ncbi:MAG TPA: AraC family transcriptional regulator [Puia sp.]|nr:AraC family transcriptional regulator [Puia sp.]
MENIYFSNIISFVANHSIVDIHYHKCYQIVITLHIPFNSIIDKNKYYHLKGFLVNQDITHSCEAENTDALIYFIDAESYMGWQLREILDGAPFMAIDSILGEEELTALIEQYGRASTVEELRQMAGGLLRKIVLSRGAPMNRVLDNRIIKIVDYIDAHLDDPLSLQDISQHIFLSPERIRHLFAQEIGIPFSQYVLWKRIKAVMTQVLKDKVPIVNSVIQNGFTDQAHFARLFKRTFGVSAKNLLKNSRSVQFLTPIV